MSLGLGVLINMLGGNAESAKAFQSATGKQITALTLAEDALHFTFSDGMKLKLFDDGQSCCEKRYMVTDDDLHYYVGGELVGFEIRSAPDVADEDGEPHEVQFLVVQTTKGQFTMSNHNEHNGYYGGFSVTVEVEDPCIQG